MMELLFILCPFWIPGGFLIGLHMYETRYCEYCKCLTLCKMIYCVRCGERNLKLDKDYGPD